VAIQVFPRFALSQTNKSDVAESDRRKSGGDDSRSRKFTEPTFQRISGQFLPYLYNHIVAK
jgi:hypothetical protein